MDQGCPLSPALWSLVPKRAEERVLAAVRAVGPTGRLEAYVDDHNRAGADTTVAAGIRAFQAEILPGLALW